MRYQLILIARCVAIVVCAFQVSGCFTSIAGHEFEEFRKYNPKKYPIEVEGLYLGTFRIDSDDCALLKMLSR